MKIDYVSTVNLGLLEDAFNSGILNTSNIAKDFGKNLSLLLSHIKISFFIDDISILEAYMLKRFCNGNYIDIETSVSDSNINKEKYPITHRSIQSLFLLNKSIDDDKDVTVKPGVMLFPVKSIIKKCIATFEGQNILTIIGSLTRSPESFFMKVNSYIQDSNNNRSKDDIIIDLLIENFLKEFYSYMTYRIQYIDLLSDSTLEFMYLNHAKDDTKKFVSLSHVNTIYGTIPFVNVDTDQYQKAIDIINVNKAKNPIEDSSIKMNTTEIFFICNTSIYSFLEIFLTLPIGSILESTDIKSVYSSDQFIIPQEMSKYQSRVTSIIEKIKGEREKVKDTNNIDNYNLIQLNTKIQYTIKFKLSEISDILMTWENKINNDNLYGDENSYISKEIVKVISLMKKYAIAIYNTVMK